MKSWKVSDLLGKNLANVQGHIVGKIHDLLVDVEGWRLTDLQVRVDKSTAKELGLKAPLFGKLQILIDSGHIVSVADQVVVDIPSNGFAAYLESREG